MRVARLAVALALLGGAGCAVNSDSECRAVCTWWKGHCTAESLDGCISDCLGSTESAAQAQTRCVQGQGWPAVTTCVSASCCVRWVYGEYAYRQQCLQ